MYEKRAIEGAALNADRHDESFSHPNTTSENQDSYSSAQETLSVKEEGVKDASSTPQAGPDDAPGPTADDSAGTHQEWIEGFQLFVVMAGITLVIFLMLLDTSIVATVYFSFRVMVRVTEYETDCCRLFPKSQTSSTHCRMLRGMAVLILWLGMVIVYINWLFFVDIV